LLERFGVLLRKALDDRAEGAVGGEGIHEGRWANVKIEATQDRVTAMTTIKGS
jgi:hypothetical protein